MNSITTWISKAICLGAMSLTVALNAADSDSPNLWSGDSSFETSADQFTYPRDSTHAYHGKYSIRVENFPGPQGRAYSHKLFMGQRPGADYFLVFYARADKPTRIQAYSLTDNWRWNGARTFTIDKEWKRYELHLTPTNVTGSVHLNFNFLDKGNQTIWVDAVGLYRGKAAKEYRPAGDFFVAYDMLALNGILHAKDRAVHKYPAQVSCRNNTNKDQEVTLVCKLEDASTGKVTTLGTKKFNLAANTTHAIDLSTATGADRKLVEIPMERGYYVLRSSLEVNQKAIAQHSQPVSVVPPPQPVSEDSFFAIHFSDGYIGRDIGASWSRNFDFWSPAMMDKNGKYTIHSESRIGITTNLGMRQLRCINIHNIKDKDGKPADNKEIARYVGELIKAYQGKLNYVEIQNEPDLTWMDKSVEFAHAVKAVAPTIKALKPDMKIASAAVSGGDFHRNFTYVETVLKIAGQYLDIVSVHPYARNHYVGQDGADTGPEHSKLYERTLQLQEVIRRNGGNQEIWYGEVGWAPDVTEDYLSVASRRNASYVPRLMTVGMTAGAKKVFYFLIENCLERQRYNYGLWRAGRPLAGTVAYAVCADNLEGAKPLPPVANADYHIFPYRHRDGHLMVALWTSNRINTKIFLPIPQEKITQVQDMFGRVISANKLDAQKRVELPIGGEMLYMHIDKSVKEETLIQWLKDSVCEIPPVRFTWTLESDQTMLLDIENIRTQKLEGMLKLSGVDFKVSSQPLVMEPGESRCYRLRSWESVNGKTLNAQITSNLGQADSTWRSNILSIARCTPSSLKLEADQWPLEMTPLPTMDSWEHILPSDPTNGWDGPQNLSVRSAISYDDKYMYLFIDVRDDIHHQNYNPGWLWRGDCVQLALDTRANAQFNSGYDNDDFEFGFALMNDGRAMKELYITTDSARKDTILESVRYEGWRKGDVTSYRIAIPWYQLKLEGKKDTIFGMNFTVNDNDGTHMRFWMGLTPGIVEGKNPNIFLKFMTK